MSYRLIVCSCIDSNLLLELNCSNRKLGEYEDYLLRHLHGSSKPPRPHWSHCFIDEAPQATECILNMPLSVVAPFQHTDQTQPKPLVKIALIGDPNQLGPIITSNVGRNKELDVSLLERLVELKTYRSEHRREDRPVQYLIKNYRSHPAILAMPNILFYNDRLTAFAHQNTIHTDAIKWTGFPNRNIPIMVRECVGTDEWIAEVCRVNRSKSASLIIIRALHGTMKERSNPQYKQFSPWYQKAFFRRVRFR